MAIIKRIWIWFLLRKMFWDFEIEVDNMTTTCRFSNKRLDCQLDFYNHYPTDQEWNNEIKWLTESFMRK